MIYSVPEYQGDPEYRSVQARAGGRFRDFEKIVRRARRSS